MTVVSMFLLNRVAEWLGLGGQVALAVFLAGLALWITKGLGVARSIGSTITGAIRTGVFIVVFIAAGTALGFIHLEPSAFFGLLGSVGRAVGGFVGRFGDDALRYVTGLFGVVSA